jgi:hypothetical protein
MKNLVNKKNLLLPHLLPEVVEVEQLQTPVENGKPD